MAKNLLTTVAWMIVCVLVGIGTHFFTSESLLTAEAEVRPKIQTAAYAAAACAATEQKLGTCQLRIVVPADSIGLSFEQYAIVGGVVLRDNGEEQAEVTELPSACFVGDCTVSLPEGSEEAPPAAVQSPTN